MKSLATAIFSLLCLVVVKPKIYNCGLTEFGYNWISYLAQLIKIF